ncbi:copper resistance protein [Amycolatopsis sp. WAC 01376]|uniref:copper resistance D family protein n=1 Tax=Amycolatopsis sp. WAC 01376 TaxID=2203195 RepID=UPI000F7B97EA|nr:CopD family protein [Amycolatopsis sp. WAC 01376]RSM63609.1 copper resistance protein [Amycolatopsis sp. WAC 01376]
MTLFAGGLFFFAFLWPAGAEHSRARKVVGIGWLLGLAGTVAGLGLQGAWAAQRPAADLFDWDLLGQGLDTQFGRVWFAKALLWLLAGVVLADLLQRGRIAAKSTAWRVGAGVVTLGLLRTTGLTGHAVESGRPLLTQVADLVHLAGICAWIGGLAVLLFGVLSRRDPGELAAVVPRYSRLAMLSVLAVVVAGVVLAWQTVGSWDRLSTTDYGRTLLVKLLVLAFVLIIAQGSKSWVSRRLDFAVVLRGNAATVRPFVYSVAAETALVIVVLLAASLLVTASPGR